MSRYYNKINKTSKKLRSFVYNIDLNVFVSFYFLSNQNLQIFLLVLRDT